MVHVYDEVFRENFHIYYGKPIDEVLCGFKKFDIEADEKTFDGVCGLTLHYDDFIVIWTKEEKPSVLAHEILHAVVMTLIPRRVELTKETEEVYCYLLEMILRKVLK